ncbi:MAG: HDOD domain-containing protein [Planctomycetes bacterium]|nr:HDOD domain-containing protein [Planctomycetota bacterium]
MRRILFVDDEEKLLQGLRRMLRPMRHEWDMTFVPDGREALAALDRQPFDVLVTDMRMPGLDGPGLLAEVRRQHPHIVRIVLSGHSSKNTTVRSVGLAHRYLSKPCDKETLEGAITRALELREEFRDESLVKLLTQVQSLPSLPRIYTEVLAELQSEDMSVKRIGEIISTDLAMAAKVLQLVNSAFFGLPRSISDPAQAVTLLGADTVKTLVLAVGVFSQFNKDDADGFDFQVLWEHSIRSAAIAKRIAMEECADRRAAEDAFTGALLHDVGKLILAQGFPKRYSAALDEATERSITHTHAERETFGSTHAEVGAYLLALWGLPDSIVAAVAYHHSPGAASETAFGTVTAVHVANSLEHHQHAGHDRGSFSQLDRDHLSHLGLLHRIEAWQERVAGQVAAAAPCTAGEGIGR